MASLLIALIYYFLMPLLTLLLFVLLGYVIMSWLFTFNVVSYRNPTARQIYEMLASVIEPLVQPIRRVVPPLGQLDLSIFVLALSILFVRDFVLGAVVTALSAT